MAGSFWDGVAKTFFEGGFSPQSFTGPGSEIVWKQLKPWFASISTKGALRWIPRAATQLPCQVPYFEFGVPIAPCVHSAVDTCVVCGKPVCLSHSFANDQGELVCYLCVASLKEWKDPKGTHEHAKKSEQAPPPPNPREAAKQQAWWARGVLGIQEGVSWETVRKQYRTLSAQYHPDNKKSGNEKVFKDVQRAYDVLKILYGEN